MSQDQTLTPTLRSYRLPASGASLVALALVFSACAETDEDNTPFLAKTMGQSIAPSAPLAINDRYLAYPASELGTGVGGTDFNNDGDTNDDVLVVLNLSNDEVTQLGVSYNQQAENIGWLGDNLFFVTDEADEMRDWNNDGDFNDRVLLRWFPGTDVTHFADMIQRPIFFTDSALIFDSGIAPAAVGDTNLRRISLDAGGLPVAPELVRTSYVDVAANGLELVTEGVSNGLFWMEASEVAEGVDLNGDADVTDTNVLVVLGDQAGREAQLVGLSTGMFASANSVLAIPDGTDTIVCVTVSETSQNANLNDPALFNSLWHPTQCSGAADVDSIDEVLHWFRLDDFTVDPVLNAPINTGLAVSSKIYHLGTKFIGAICFESSEGTCDLNGDGDNFDGMLRWIELTPTAIPMGLVNKLVALDTTIAGGTEGVIALDNALWVAFVDEAADGRDYDGNVVNRRFLGVLDPELPGTTWNFDQGSNTFITPSWMQQDPSTDSRFLAAITEASTGVDRNLDGDFNDSVPTFPREGGAPRELDFPGVNVAVEINNAGMYTVGNYGFYRISEADQEFDYNLDGDFNDEILQRVDLTGGSQATSMGIVTNGMGPVVVSGRGNLPRGIVWLAPENQQGPSGTDLNMDGDTSDTVVRFSRLP